VTTADLAAGFDAIFAGTLETFQIWKRDAYEGEIAAQSLTEVEELSGGLDMLALLPSPEA
jgi:MraZ protein